MGKGRYLKAAERACSRKSRFETRAAAEAFVAHRYRAYRCVVCGAYHLTSGRGGRAEPPEPPKREPPGPKLSDLDWSAVLGPKEAPPIGSSTVPSTWGTTPDERANAFASCPSADPSLLDEGGPPVEPSTRGNEERRLIARCVAPPGRDGRVLLVFDGRLVKSRPVVREMRRELTEGVQVEVEGTPPTVMRVGV